MTSSINRLEVLKLVGDVYARTYSEAYPVLLNKYVDGAVRCDERAAAAANNAASSFLKFIHEEMDVQIDHSKEIMVDV
jgi:hypothetical protein